MMTRVICIYGMLSVGDGPVVENGLCRHPGIYRVEANCINCTATVYYDESVITLADIEKLVEDIGYHCLGESMSRNLSVVATH